MVVGTTNVLDAITAAAASGGTALDSSSDVEVASVAATLVKAYSGAALTLGNNAGTGIVVSNSGAVGVLKTSPQEALDVYGNCAISGTISVDRIYANIYSLPRAGPIMHFAIL